MLNAIVEAELPETLCVCRCEIADDGRLGFMTIEGPERNPRLDDLQIVAFDAAVDDAAVSRWLRSSREQREEEVGSILEEINVGISCSSETMRLSDDVVSTHAAAMSRCFRAHAMGRTASESGSLQVGWCGNGDGVNTVVQRIHVPPFTVHSSPNDPSWQVRLRAELVEEMKGMLRIAAPNETGGILIGAVNLNRKIVYVTRVLPEPPDSKGTPYAFVRGIEDVPGVVKEIEDATGGTLGYVGEWHTHPSGGPRLSKTDRKAVRNLKKTLDTVPLPTLVAIVTGDGFHPHVFAPETGLA
jgi:integrative and conjugative element protein (TIGR02256 family)